MRLIKDVFSAIEDIWPVLLITTLYAGLWIGIAYVVVHFITKYW